MLFNARMVVVGAGEAGARAALALREYGFDGKVTLFGSEQHAPYERPPLSKSMLYSSDEPVPKAILGEGQCREYDIQLQVGCPIVSIDRADRSVVCGDGTAVRYDKLLIATGSQPRKLHIKGAHDAHYLRTFSDAVELRGRLRPGIRLTVIGAGFIGLEIAASAIQRGCEVTVVETAPRALTRGVPEQVSKAVTRRHKSAGVTFRFGVEVAEIRRTTNGLAVFPTQGEAMECDSVVVGIGAIPETGLAMSCGLALENGVKVDETLRTNDQHIYAAGDCCSFPHSLFDGRRIRLEAWRNALDQGAAAAANMLGAEQPYVAIPSFWSDQYEQTMQIVGLPDAGVTTVHRSGVGELYFHLAANGRIVAASGIGPTGKVARDIALAVKMIEQKAQPDPAALISSSASLKSLLTS